MGSELWTKWVRYEKSLQRSLKAAQRDVLEELGFPSLQSARDAYEADGTASPVDIDSWSDEPEPGACWAPDEDTVERFFGSATPSRDDVEAHVDELVMDLGRGESLAVVAWEKGKPAHVLFTGWSFD